jgi:hypothetical protein
VRSAFGVKWECRLACWRWRRSVVGVEARWIGGEVDQLVKPILNQIRFYMKSHSVSDAWHYLPMAKQIVEILQRNLERLVGPERRFPTAAALANRARMGTTTVQRARNGVSAIRIDNLEDMAHAVGLPCLTCVPQPSHTNSNRDLQMCTTSPLTPRQRLRTRAMIAAEFVRPMRRNNFGTNAWKPAEQVKVVVASSIMHSDLRSSATGIASGVFADRGRSFAESPCG